MDTPALDQPQTTANNGGVPPSPPETTTGADSTYADGISCIPGQVEDITCVNKASSQAFEFVFSLEWSNENTGHNLINISAYKQLFEESSGHNIGDPVEVTYKREDETVLNKRTCYIESSKRMDTDFVFARDDLKRPIDVAQPSSTIYRGIEFDTIEERDNYKNTCFDPRFQDIWRKSFPETFSLALARGQCKSLTWEAEYIKAIWRSWILTRQHPD